MDVLAYYSNYYACITIYCSTKIARCCLVQMIISKLVQFNILQSLTYCLYSCTQFAIEHIEELAFPDKETIKPADSYQRCVSRDRALVSLTISSDFRSLALL